jgi:hypothetical protein
MKLLIGAARMELELSPGEVLLLSNVLNEVCSGFALQNFDARMGASEAQVRRTFEKMQSLSTQEKTRVPVTHEELSLLQNALTEALRELGADDFPIRTGVDFEVGEAVLRELERCTADAHLD